MNSDGEGVTKTAPPQSNPVEISIEIDRDGSVPTNKYQSTTADYCIRIHSNDENNILTLI